MKIIENLISSALVVLLFIALPVSAAGISSDFIEDLPDMKSDADRPGAQIWEKPGFDRAAYTKLMMEPITIFIHPKSKYKGIDADQMKALSDEFHKVIVETLEPDIPVVNKAGKGVLYVRAAITNVKLKKKKRGLLSFTPIGFVVRTATDLAGKNINMVDANMELEVRDSQTGELLVVLVDTKPGKMDEKKEHSWAEIQETFKFYAERFRQRVEQAK